MFHLVGSLRWQVDHPSPVRPVQGGNTFEAFIDPQQLQNVGFFYQRRNPINVNLPSDSELSKHVLQRWEGSLLGSSFSGRPFRGKIQGKQGNVGFFPIFLNFKIATKKVNT